MNRNRPRALIIGVIAAIGVLISMAVGSATHVPEAITLTIEDGTNTFTDGVTTQDIETGKAECSIKDDSYAGDLIVMSASTYTNAGVKKNDAPIGLVEDGLGVNLRGKGNGQDCGRIDFLEDGLDADGNVLSERLKFSLGSGVHGQMISSVDFDLEAKYEATVHFWFYRNGDLIDDYAEDIGEGSDSGPDSKFRDKYAVTAETSEGLFDAIEISMESGGVSVEGGATWDEKPGDSGDNHRTVFYLAAPNASATIDDTTSGDVAGNIAAGESFTWTWTVTNTGDLDFDIDSVEVDITDNGGTTTVDIADSCTLTTLTSQGTPSDSTTCTYTIDDPPAGDIDFDADLTATSEYGGEVPASTSSTYFGVNSSISVDAKTNGVDGGSDILDPDVLYISKDAAVTWTYIVTNTGNATVTGIAVTDDRLGAITCPATTLASSDSMTCTAPVGAAAAGGYTNTAQVSATDLLGATITGSDSSGYFGSDPGVTITVVLEDPLIASDELVRWTITVTNTGNVALDLVTVLENNTAVVCPVVTIAAGAPPVVCTYTHVPDPGYTETSFKVTAEDPLGTVVQKASGTVSYIGVLACGEGDIEGEPGLADTPLVSFIVGPDNGTKPDPACSVPVHITSNVAEDGTQTVSVAPPATYAWGGVTGVVTIQWDAEDATLGPVARTYQVLSASSVPIPWCAEIVGVSPVQDAGSDLWYYDLDPAGALYPFATAGGDTCLISQHTENVDDGGVIRTQTTEVFYIWNDPIFSR